MLCIRPTTCCFVFFFFFEFNVLSSLLYFSHTAEFGYLNPVPKHHKHILTADLHPCKYKISLLVVEHKGTFCHKELCLLRPGFRPKTFGLKV